MLRKGCETGQGFIVTCSLKRSSALDYPLVCLAVYIYGCSGKRVLSGQFSRKLNTQPFGLVLSPVSIWPPIRYPANFYLLDVAFGVSKLALLVALGGMWILLVR